MVDLEKVLVVGGGIAGMSASIALAKAGYAVTLAEADPDWRVLGAGLTVLGSTLRALARLGVLEEVREAGFFAYGNDIHRYTGELLLQRDGMRLPDMDLPGSGGILRPVLHGILSPAAKAAGVQVKLGASWRGLTETADGVEVAFDNGEHGLFDLVVAADGLGSAIRKACFVAPASPTFTGQGCWRLVVDKPAEVTRSRFYVGGPVTVGVVPVSKAQAYVWVLEHVPDNPWREPEGLHRLLAELLAGCGGLVGDIRDELHEGSTIVYRPLEALLQPAPWHTGRVLLIGDAAHATTPHLASGAGMAVEDGLVLAEELRRAASLPEAFDAFMARRFERCRLVVESSVEIGRIEMARRPPAEMEALMTRAQTALAQPY